MQKMYERCCGMDVHKKTVVACVITPEGRETRTFSTMTGELLELADWLGTHGVTHVAMESTGVFWKPVYNLLEERFTVWVVNAHHVKTVPGRKTDVRDAEWIAELLQYGLVRPSFIPDRPQRELRELLRYRRSLIQERSREVNRIQKVLEGANIKLSAVASDVVGVSGRAMLNSLVAGEEDPERLAHLAKGRLQEKREALVKALRGRMGPHQRLMLESHLRHLDFLEGEVRRLSAEVEQRMAPFEGAVQQLDAIPGIGRRTAEQVLGEIGLDMERFPSAGHLASWARLCPGNNQSGGKLKSGATGHANPWLRSALTEAAQAVAHTKDTYLAAQYHRIAARRGKKRATIAVAHSLLVTIYHMLRRGTTYQELGGDYFDQRSREAVLRNAVRRIHRLGYAVTLHPTAPAPAFS